MKKFAVLIDADNTSQNTIEPILEEVAKYGIASVKRIYGDWSNDTLKNWKDKLLPNAITPVQQFAYVAKKDATDMKLVIDAMDLLYAGELDGFCIISSDSDFTPLASRIRESGLLCYGFGKKNTVDSFVNACDRFFYVENLFSEPKTDINNLPVQDRKSEQKESNQIENIEETVEIDANILNLFYKAIKDNSDDKGWANLGGIGSYINSVKPDFDTRNYGKQKLSDLVRCMPVFEIKLQNSQLLVKKFSFRQFNVCVQTILNDQQVLNAGHGWAFLSDIAKIIKQGKLKELQLEHLTESEIEAKIKCIHTNIIEFSKDKKKIRNFNEKGVSESTTQTEDIQSKQPIKNIMNEVITLSVLYETIDRYSNIRTGWANIRSVETALKKEIRFNFNTQKYGKQNFLELINSMPSLDTKTMCRERYVKIIKR